MIEMKFAPINHEQSTKLADYILAQTDVRQTLIDICDIIDWEKLAGRAAGQTPPTPREGLADKLERQFRPGLILGTKFTEGYQTCLNDLRVAERAAGQTSGEAPALDLGAYAKEIAQIPVDLHGIRWSSKTRSTSIKHNHAAIIKVLERVVRAALGQTSTAPERKL